MSYQGGGVNIVAFVTVLVFGYLGQSLMKAGLRQIKSAESSGSNVLSFYRASLTEPLVLLGLACVIIGFLGWLLFLSRTEISRAMPLLALSYIPWVLIGKFVFDEPMSVFRWLGVILIALGVILSGK